MGHWDAAMQPNTRQEDDLFRLLIQNVEEYAIFLLDPTGHVRSWNAGAQRIKRYSAQEIIGKHFSIFYPPEEVRRGKPAYALRVALEEGHWGEEGWRVRRDGSRFWASVVITALFDPAGQHVGFAKVTRDLTERKQAEEERARLLELERGTRARAESALEQLRGIEVVTETALAHLELDTLLTTLLDRVSEVLNVDTVAILLLQDDEGVLIPRAAKGLEEEVEAGIRLPLGRGFAGRIAAERRPIVLDDLEHADVLNPILRRKGVKSLLGAPLVVEGRVLGVLHVGTLYHRRFTEDDVRFLQIVADRAAMAIEHARLYAAARLAREEAGAAVQAVQVRDEFLAAASHDLKNPLAAIKGIAQLLHRRARRASTLEGQSFADGLQRIDATITRMTRLIDSLLDVSRVQMGQPLPLDRRPLDLVALAREAAEEQQQSSDRHQLRVDAAVPELIGVWDAHRLERVLANLLNNAVKYSPAGGEVTLIVRPDAEAGAPWAVVMVQDRGLGIPAADLPRIFERFQRAQNVQGHIAGTGIGLAIARQIVEQHGGRVTVESEEGEGTTFTVRLPLALELARTPDPEP
jgi:PAS domain S-box-containing protein